MTPDSQSRLHNFIHHETTAGLILVAAAVLAMVCFNAEALRPVYESFLGARTTIAIGSIGLSKPLVLWINDGLMAVFFFLVGLEIKREVIEGNLSRRENIILPALAAAGGMAAPALVYTLFNAGDPALMRGWAIPAATDIAFALGALSLAGSRVPPALKVFLLTLATLDDLGAIVIIALFYASDLSLLSLVLAGAALVTLLALNILRVDRLALYLLIGVAMWVFVLKSGVHATLAGVALALLIPMNRRDGSSLLHGIEEALHPYVKFLILPLFAFANAGIPLDGFALDKLTQPLPSGIAAGLVVGKPMGIMLTTWAAIRLGLASLPANTTWIHMAGVSCLAGIGFTMSLFIGGLAFEDATLQASVRVGVVAGSVISTILGIAVLLAAGRPKT